MKNKALPFSYLIEKNRDAYNMHFENDYERKKYYDRDKRKNKIEHINEATRKELIKYAEIKRKGRAKKLIVNYQGVTDSRGWIKFLTTSQYTVGKKYTQYIKLNEANDIKYFKEFKKNDIVRLFMNGDLSVYCSCKDFKYRQKYMGYNMGYGIFKEMRFPKVTNPNLEGTVCKHLIAVLTVANWNWTSIAKDMKRSKFFKKKYDDDEMD